MRLITVVGTRPEIIRLSCIIKKADKFFDHILVHTGQNWDKNLSDVFFSDLGIKQPDHYLNVVGKNLGESVGNIISKTYDLFRELKPDAILILGDTNSCLCAMSAKRLKIPIFHMEAGNRCFDYNVPEEINRKVVDNLSDVNLPYTENSRRYLLNEGFPGQYIFVTGSPISEVVNDNLDGIKNSNILEKLGVKKGEYFLLSLHREENIDIEKNLKQVLETLDYLVEKYKIPIIFSTHPRTKKRISENNIQLDPLIRSMDPMGYFDYCQLQLNAKCVLSDSGTITEESAILNFPAVSFRICTERPEGLDKGNIVIGSINKDRIIESINLSIELHHKEGNTIIPYDYKDSNVSDKVLKIIQSYTPIVNRYIWMK